MYTLQLPASDDSSLCHRCRPEAKAELMAKMRELSEPAIPIGKTKANANCALLEEVVSALNSYKTSLGYFVGSEDYQKQVTDLIARVRAEWGNG